MVESKLKSFLFLLGLKFSDFEAFMVGQAVSEYNGEPLYFSEDVINFVATFRTADYQLQKESK